MNRTFAVVTGLILLVLLLLFSSTFTVKYNEIAIKTRFGGADENSVVSDQGLNFKLPIVNRVAVIDRRLQLVETSMEEVELSDGIHVVVKGFLLWRVKDGTDDAPTAPIEFYKSFETVGGAKQTVGNQLRTALTGSIQEFTFDELVGQDSKLADAEERARLRLVEAVDELGVEPVVVGVSQLQLPQRAARAVVERMTATRQALAEAQRQKGQSEANRIAAEANTNAEKILAFAAQRAQEIRADAERDAAKYIEELAEDPELAIFLEWKDALERSLSQYTNLVISTDDAPFHLLERRGDSGSIPMPRSGDSDDDDTEIGGE